MEDSLPIYWMRQPSSAKCLKHMQESVGTSHPERKKTEVEAEPGDVITECALMVVAFLMLERHDLVPAKESVGTIQWAQARFRHVL